MPSDHINVREFRDRLRRLERIVGAHSKVCCPGVSLAQCHLLLEIGRLKTATTTGLARSLVLDPSTVSRTVDGLVKLGLVQRNEDRKDRRSIPLRLAAKGRGRVSAINSDADSFFKAALKCIPSKQRSQTLSCFETLVNALGTAEQMRKHSSSCGDCNCSKS
jgi:DNA-binding MarR family transcriptional regulator